MDGVVPHRVGHFGWLTRWRVDVQYGRIMWITSFLGGVLQPLSLSLAMMFVDRAGLGTVLVAVGALNLAMVFLTAWLLPLREKEWTLSTPKA